MRATKKLLEKNIALQNANVALMLELSVLRGLCDDAYGLIVDHHAHGQMLPSVCGVCSRPLGKSTMRRLGQIREESNKLRVTAKQDERQKRMGYDSLGPRQLDELGDDEP